MNDRIRQLADDAKKYALDAMIKITDKEQALKVYSESYDTKFAELIVKECLDQCYNRGMNDAFYAGQLQAAAYIEQHFGVEE